MTQQANIFTGRITQDLRLPYLIFLPKGYSDRSDQQWPLILFLHGRGERADNDMILLRKHGIPKLADDWDRPFITLAPQCPPTTWWALQIDALIGLLDETLGRYTVDPKRVYLTGLSMGGFGSWLLGSMHPQRFAAVVPICGGWSWVVDHPGQVQALKDTPVWAFHGAKDPIVPLWESERLVKLLQECGSNVRFTVYPEAGHDSWTETYNDPELYHWLLEQHL